LPFLSLSLSRPDDNNESILEKTMDPQPLFSFFPFYFIHSQSSNIYPELWSFLFYSFQELLSPSSSCLLFEQVSILPFFFREILHLLKVWPLPPILVGGLLHIFHSASDYRAHRRDRREKTRSPLAGSIDTWSIFCSVYLLRSWFFSTGVGAESNVLSFSSMSGGGWKVRPLCV
jgi:hypothetical protein